MLRNLPRELDDEPKLGVDKESQKKRSKRRKREKRDPGSASDAIIGNIIVIAMKRKN